MEIDLSTKYMGLTIKSPIIASSSDFTNSVEKIVKLEKAGVGAVVLKSIFEEQILMEIDAQRVNNIFNSYENEENYIAYYTKQHNLNEYLKLIKDAQKNTSIPIIASIHCSTDDEWIKFVKEIELAGADGIELNIFIIPSSIDKTEKEIRETYFNIINKVRSYTKLPLAVKIHYYFTDLAKFAYELSTKVDSIVLFNRFYNPDINIDTFKTGSAGTLSQDNDNFIVLRWVSLLSNKIQIPIIASGGVHHSSTLIKNIMAGANAVQIASVIYNQGFEAVEKMKDELKQWMESKNISNIKEIQQKIKKNSLENVFERAQFMKYFSDFNT